MSMLWRADGKTRRLCFGGAFCLFALALSYAERFVPIGLIVPLPGVRLGLANIAVIMAFVFLSPGYGAAVSMVRIAVSAVLFGNAFSFPLSLAGGAMSWAVMWLVYVLFRESRCFSFIGVCVLCACAHSIGQIAAASLLICSAGLWRYLGVLLVSSAAAGFLTGTVLNLTIPRISAAAEKYLSKR